MNANTQENGESRQPATTDDAHLSAYNGAFWDLGFKWQWDADIYRDLCNMPDEKERIRAYVVHHQSHLTKAYDLDFLIDLIHANKTRRHAAIVAANESGRPPDLNCNGVRGD